ncbi:amino acid ABC transporter membrane protein, PAAT family [Kytococcus aerolatus]|uniref:Amino acid ABC transporter membrane protein, PAAT family n=1 Tax=Kytococcus aerolatus TaxID=592308 RepID=A0A212U207_9MICO|nr:amino acid ABC transporter permease [Kytococcus aerolatus]SNC72279.1 amino acid ABC transporter membrane protein, PAAT family [Kytococcus aerolatus]
MTRTQRNRATQGVLYALFTAVLLALVVLADWKAIGHNFFKPEGFTGSWEYMVLTAAKNTIVYTAIAFAGGFLLAVPLVLMKLSPAAPLRWLATAWVELFRGLPALIVILFMGVGVPIAFNGWTPPGGMLGAGLGGLMLVASAYMAETLRAGIQAVPKGQIEAARSLGMSPARTMLTVTFPQAIRIVIPPLTNELVLLIKDTSLLFVLGFMVQEKELTTAARDFMSSGPSAGTATSLVFAAMLYLAITLPLTQLVAWLERRQSRRSR